MICLLNSEVWYDIKFFSLSGYEFWVRVARLAYILLFVVDFIWFLCQSNAFHCEGKDSLWSVVRNSVYL